HYDLQRRTRIQDELAERLLDDNSGDTYPYDEMEENAGIRAGSSTAQQPSQSPVMQLVST
ncbi:unnamed protein product, partial [Amoebophrya sp. A25]